MQHPAPTPGYKLLPAPHSIVTPHPRNIIKAIYKTFVFIVSLLLIALGLRLICAVLVIDTTFTRILTMYTEPFVRPFSRTFPDSNNMLQTSTATAFTSYYIFLNTTSYITKRIKQTNKSSTK